MITTLHMMGKRNGDGALVLLLISHKQLGAPESLRGLFCIFQNMTFQNLQRDGSELPIDSWITGKSTFFSEVLSDAAMIQ